MAQFNENLNIQMLIGLFVLVLCFVLGVLGFLLRRFEFLDGRSFYFSRTLGAILMMISGILALAALIMLLYVRVTLV